MISCPKCGKENQDHYKFCLGCGNELPRDGGAPRPFRPTPPAVSVGGSRPTAGSSPNVAPPPGPYGAPAPAPPVMAAPPPPFAQPPQVAPAPFAPPPPQPAPFAPPAPIAPPIVAQAPAAPPLVQAAAGPQSAPAGFPTVCPQCASPNPRGNRFCITCGFDMSTITAPPVAAPPSAPSPVPAPPQPSPAMAAPAPVPAPAPVAPPAPRAVERGRLVLIRPDGSEGATFPLHDGENLVGREVGGVFANDMYLSPRHALFNLTGSNITVRDESSLNGIYVRIERQAPVELQNGDVFRIGQEILRYDAFPPVTRQNDGTERLGAEVEGLVGKVSLVTGRDTVGNAFPLPVTGIYLGRERGDILFPEDGYVSGLHCQISVAAGKITLVDVGSSNGTYVRIKGPRTVRHGDFLLLGQQLFRIQLNN